MHESTKEEKRKGKNIREGTEMKRVRKIEYNNTKRKKVTKNISGARKMHERTEVKEIKKKLIK